MGGPGGDTRAATRCPRTSCAHPRDRAGPRHSGKCLDVPASSTANSTRLKQYPCNGGANQRWTL
ncbi:RICIN domain-containing protein [Promicromonospora iranensis]|uniref:RICIN domain-containing protein n=1 Tax=Promicromonospora iranensis TaxID=1105144 RepID=UPI003CD0D60F